ncbi:UDP-N-acetylmuramoyl-tripeptide--D-alanyl-D-alanine ligase [Thalassotalea agarivorans]|uniref:UDP-N-acetylmuramoyl-tripeptide--D-alanyl-D-alanine ligase n=1 Tax=Thalassotalea agarivorans TaxID=349064 RepID=A0A1I0AZU8_THASX|nr:UDP-N-acetylmuramoyl-tripeptide--D-alanyl-D-alanine ligase [Thalassotalea agarivorans]SES99992.1 UDP-N-acetylmuramoyl-tripeptide--D-alanyl-D-alanine ligase [Thalassotalea agarivorans]
MISLSLSEIATAVSGELIGKDITIESVTTDSRALTHGDVFLALKGANFDGHRFVEQVLAQGASAVIVSTKQKTDTPQIVVNDTHKALGLLGAYVKQQVAPKTVAITGSSGKTTVKEMVAAILSRLGNVLATAGNFNNDIGVPLTLLRLEKQHEFAVMELGANHIGEISYTSGLVKPDISVINNIAAAHLEGFGDLCGVARAKGEIYEGLKPGGIALYNKDCKYAHKWQWRLTDKTVKTFSCLNKADVYSENVSLNAIGCPAFTLNANGETIDITLPIPGRHNVCNAVAAATIALEFGATLEDIQQGLEQMAPVKGRLNLHKLSDDFTVIDDTYNANVESNKAAAELLASYSGKRVLILGDMAELGSEARNYHHEVGAHAKGLGIDNLLTLGVLSQNTSMAFNGDGYHFTEREMLIEQLKQLVVDEKQPVTILVKGSRSSHMENVVKDILAWHKNTSVEEQV